MPELPEVETIVKDLRKKIVSQKIIDIDIRLKKIVKNKPDVFCRILINKSFQKIIRRGKYIFFQIKQEKKYLMIHLRMTGQLIYQKGDKIIAGGHSDRKNILEFPNKQTHIIFYFKNGSRLFYNDQRQFGILKIINQEEFNLIDRKQGIEPLADNFSLQKFKELISRKKKNIKAFLLDQSLIAGIGNIYADESLFKAGISPFRKTSDLNEKEKTALYRAVRHLLKKALKYRGTTFNDYRDAYGRQGNFLNKLKIYGRDGKKCFRCGKEIKKVKLAGRGTRYCSYCQK